MHGLGNDFVIIDARKAPVDLDSHMITHICNRHQGVGCDQLVVVGASTHADAAVTFYNQDGSTSSACGNATRCVADMLATQLNKDAITLEANDRILSCQRIADKTITVDMGQAYLSWQDIPLSHDMDIFQVRVSDELDPGVAVGMGNPHIVLFVESINTVDVVRLGEEIESHVFFPERVNVNFAHINAPDKITLCVYERGAGITQACGSGACATAVAAYKRGLINQKVTVSLPGGELIVDVSNLNHIAMTGPVAYVFKGQMDV